MKKKKHDLNYHTRKTVFSMYWIQIASLLTFYMVYFVFKCFFHHISHCWCKACEAIYQIFFCFFNCISLIGFSHWCK